MSIIQSLARNTYRKINELNLHGLTAPLLAKQPRSNQNHCQKRNTFLGAVGQRGHQVHEVRSRCGRDASEICSDRRNEALQRRMQTMEDMSRSKGSKMNWKQYDIGEVDIAWKFNNEETVKSWKCSCDNDWEEGFSSASFRTYRLWYGTLLGIPGCQNPTQEMDRSAGQDGSTSLPRSRGKHSLAMADITGNILQLWSWGSEVTAECTSCASGSGESLMWHTSICTLLASSLTEVRIGNMYGFLSGDLVFTHKNRAQDYQDFVPLFDVQDSGDYLHG